MSNDTNSITKIALLSMMLAGLTMTAVNKDKPIPATAKTENGMLVYSKNGKTVSQHDAYPFGVTKAVAAMQMAQN